MSSFLKKATVVSIPTVRQALLRSNPIVANALLARNRSYNSKGGAEVLLVHKENRTKQEQGAVGWTFGVFNRLVESWSATFITLAQHSFDGH